MFLSESDAKLVALEVMRLLRPMLSINGGNGERPPSKPTVPKRLMTLEETARYIGRTKSAVEKLIFRHELDACVVRMDRRVFIDRIALDKLIDSGRI